MKPNRYGDDWLAFMIVALIAAVIIGGLIWLTP